MYKHGKPVYRLTHRPAVVTTLFLVLIFLGIYFFLVKPNIGNTLNNNATARKGEFSAAKSNDTPVSQPVFSLTLPGPWKLSSVDWDARYHAYQWNSSDKKNNGRLFRVYVDSIPNDQAVNYLLPVKVTGNVMTFGTVSTNCVNFTKGAVPESGRPADIPINKIALPSRWGLVDFLCDNGNVSHQVVGASSEQAINTISLKGQTSGSHKFFFMYQDNSLSPDFGQFESILTSFQVK